MADNIKTQEQRHLNSVIKKIKISETDLEKKIKSTKKDVKDIYANFNNDVHLKTSTYSGMMETAMSIRQQQQMLSERENRQEHAARELGTLNKLEKNPYFARIDFREGTEDHDETIYIGMASYTDKPDHYLIY
ncbi:MAG: ATP-dependent DNA helicase, partial [Lentilactobacillus hilgardii]